MLKIYRFLITVSLGCFAITAVKGQQLPLINSGAILDSGQNLSDQGDYKNAIRLYQQVSRSDTNYQRILVSLAAAYFRDSNYEASSQTAALGLELFPHDANSWYNLIGVSLEGKGKYREAMDYFDSLLAVNPNSYLGWFNKGIAYLDLNSYDSAGSCLEKCLLINPFYTSAHYFLGKTCIMEGKLPQAILCLMTDLAIDPENQYAHSTVQFLTGIANVTDEIATYASQRKPEKEDNFDLSQEILLSKIALDPKYKLQTSLEDPITRQLQALLEKINYEKNDQGFFMQFYVPIYQAFYSDNQYDALVNYLFRGLNIKSVEEFNKKNKKAIDALIDRYANYLNLIRKTRVLNADQRSQATYVYNYTSGTLTGEGKVRDNGGNSVQIGPWVFYFDNGMIRSRGLLNNDGQYMGTWETFYKNGMRNEIVNYHNDTLQGTDSSWFSNGVLDATGNYLNGNLEGTVNFYYYNGLKKIITHYHNGLKNGAETGYSSAGYLEYRNTYLDDKKEGPETNYYPDGSIASETAYHLGLTSGTYKKFDREGVLTMEGTYENDKETGQWRTYFPSGKPKAVYSYTDGVLQGPYQSFYENGKTEQSFQYLDGKFEGRDSDYDKDGKLYCLADYDKDRLRTLTYFDKAGKITHAFSSRNGAGFFSFYDADGNKLDDGNFSKEGERDGLSVYYYKDGDTSASAIFQNGELNGEKTSYYLNGNISEKINYNSGAADGYYQSYHENKRLSYEGWYVDGNRQQEHIAYNLLGDTVSKAYYLDDEQDGYTDFYTPNGKLDQEELYTRGWITQFTQFDSTGNILSKTDLPKGNADFVFKYSGGKDYIRGSYRNYLLSGNYEIFFFDGSPESKKYFRYGKADSSFIKYFYGGGVRETGNYQNGDKTGTWKYFYPDKKICNVSSFKNGKETGIDITYNEDGTLDNEYSFKNDELDGPCKIYGEKNNLAVILNYQEGNLISYTYQSSNGNLVDPVMLKNGSGQLVAYYKNGIKSAEIDFKENLINGRKLIYFTNGRIYDFETRILGKINGIKKVYFENGQTEEEDSFYYGNKNGPCSFYYEDGKKKAVENWYDGELNGTSTYYDKTGLIQQSMFYYYDLLEKVY